MFKDEYNSKQVYNYNYLYIFKNNYADIRLRKKNV